MSKIQEYLESFSNNEDILEEKIEENQKIWFPNPKMKIYREIPSECIFNYDVFLFLLFWNHIHKNRSLKNSFKKTNKIINHYYKNNITLSLYNTWLKKYKNTLLETNQINKADQAFLHILDEIYIQKNQKVKKLINDYNHKNEYNKLYELDDEKKRVINTYNFIKSELYKW